ncbi:alanine racemase [Nocardioides piscis]|uniref:Alanine racemase n=1 Tax=Nocardioides piscis TaxID=2714938 RepID=A0A6G7YDP7_9ACTN|nr:alanine racemase [Nocardioides piscis]QIK74942.1 alanine racemase [Nocardioides piscis]
MGLELTVDGERWRRHLVEATRARPGIVPVAKGNGYGFGLGRLARRCAWLAERAADTGSALDLMAVGTYPEVSQVVDRFAGDVMVLTPWRPSGATGADPEPHGRRVIHTVSRPTDLEDLTTREPGARFVLEQLTSMRRHGMTRHELIEVARVIEDRKLPGLCGIAVHLPLNVSSHLAEVRRLLNDVVATGLRTRTVFVSHLSPAELTALRSEFGDFTIRPRVGTDLWLGDRTALKATATVLDVHPLERGETFGYRGRSLPRSGHLVIVSGGTAHGIGLEAPLGDQSLRNRAATIARSGLDAVGLVRSPFAIDGKQRLFAEPPHMQASMLFVPSGGRVPDVGEDLEVRVRFTATSFDRVVVV